MSSRQASAARRATSTRKHRQLLPALAATLLSLWSAAAQPADPQPPARIAGPVPRLANGKPDFSGHWANPHVTNMALRVVDPNTRTVRRPIPTTG